MALYRHVKNKQDLVNAMYEAVVEGFDLKAGIRPSMKWTSQLRRSLMNVIALHERPVAPDEVGRPPAVCPELVLSVARNGRTIPFNSAELNVLQAGDVLVVVDNVDQLPSAPPGTSQPSGTA